MDDDNTRAKKLFSQNLGLEKELRNLLKKKNPLDKDLITLRETLRDNYEKIIFLDYDLATSKEVEQSLWKVAFYKVIEEFRVQIRKCVSASEVRHQRHNSTEVTKRELDKLATAFRIFLDNATKFYTDFLKKFQSHHNLNLDKPAPEDDKRYLTIHRTLIFLGDLARYRRELYSNNNDWTAAAKYYRHASRLIPSYGNPHNQLAVLSIYADDEFQAVYHYFRSLAVTHPFLTARDNLIVLFEKNRQRLLEDAHPLSKKNRNSHFSSVHSSSLKKVLAKFVRLHGILFSKTSLETFEGLKSSTISEFETLLNQQSESVQLTDDLLMQLFVINMFGVSNVSWAFGGQQAQYADVSLRSELMQKAVTLAIDTFLVVAQYSYKTADLKYLKSTSLFLEWLKYNTHSIRSSDFGPSHWKAARECLAAFLNFISPLFNDFLQLGYDPEHAECSGRRPLPEEAELQGFVPLSEAFSHLNFSHEALSDVMPVPSSTLKAPDLMNQIKSASRESSKSTFPEYQECIARRMNKIRTFGLIAANTQVTDLPNERLLYKKDDLFVTKLDEVGTEEHPSTTESRATMNEVPATYDVDINTKSTFQSLSTTEVVEKTSSEKFKPSDKPVQILKSPLTKSEPSTEIENEINIATTNDADVEDEVILFKPMNNGNTKASTDTSRKVAAVHDKEPTKKRDETLLYVEQKSVSTNIGQHPIGSERPSPSSNVASNSVAVSSLAQLEANQSASTTVGVYGPPHYSPFFSPSTDLSSLLNASTPQVDSHYTSKNSQMTLNPSTVPNLIVQPPQNSSFFSNDRTHTTTSLPFISSAGFPSIWTQTTSSQQFLSSIPPGLIQQQHTPSSLPIAPPPGFDDSRNRLEIGSAPFLLNTQPIYSPFVLPGFQQLPVTQQQDIQQQLLQLQQLQRRQEQQQKAVTLQTSNPFVT